MERGDDALPMLRRNNTMALALNNQGQVIGVAENGTHDSHCKQGVMPDLCQLKNRELATRKHVRPQ